MLIGSRHAHTDYVGKFITTYWLMFVRSYMNVRTYPAQDVYVRAGYVESARFAVRARFLREEIEQTLTLI